LALGSVQQLNLTAGHCFCSIQKNEKKRGLPHTGYLFGFLNKYIGTSETLELISVALYVLLLS
jgi:hypothetical protein